MEGEFIIMNTQQGCPMMQTKYANNYNQMTMGNYNPCTNCLYRSPNNNMNYGSYNYSENYYAYPSRQDSIYAEMKPVALEDILE